MTRPQPHLTVLGTPDLRIAYNARRFTFSDRVSENSKTVVIIGSCRVVPFLNYLRVYNAMSTAGDAMNLICLNPVEMWKGVGSHVADGVNEMLKDFRLGRVDYLICEHVQYCGALNTVRSSPQNIYDNLGCEPAVEMRLPNWNQMHIFDLETEMWDTQRQGYSLLTKDERVLYLREHTEQHKAKFLSHCSSSTYPDLADWVRLHWLDIRIGWSSNHPTKALLSQIFSRITQTMGLDVSCGFLEHPICNDDLYASTGFQLTDIDRLANQWRF
jgi:hypothetical protein